MANGKDKSEKAEATCRSAFSVPDLVTAAAIVIEDRVRQVHALKTFTKKS
jgi:hypothetical protein